MPTLRMDSREVSNLSPYKNKLLQRSNTKKQIEVKQINLELLLSYNINIENKKKIISFKSIN